MHKKCLKAYFKLNFASGKEQDQHKNAIKFAKLVPGFDTQDMGGRIDFGEVPKVFHTIK